MRQANIHALTVDELLSTKVCRNCVSNVYLQVRVMPATCVWKTCEFS